MPDLVTASEEYALRFAGEAGAYLLSVQARTVASMLDAAPAIPEHAAVLDHAGTHGQLAVVFESRGLQRTVSASSNDLIDRSGLNSPKVVGNLCDLDVDDGAFDTVVSVRLLAHAADLEATVAEMCRLARCSVIVDYPSLRSVNIFSRWLFKYKKRIERDTREYTSISDGQLKRLFAQNGFQLVELERQFFIPMALHRAIGNNALMRGLENLARWTGLLKAMGNPAVARFDRVENG